MMDEDQIEPRYLPLQRFERVELLDEASREPKNFDMEEFIHKNNLGLLSAKIYTPLKRYLIKPWLIIF